MLHEWLHVDKALCGKLNLSSLWIKPCIIQFEV